MDNRHFDDSQLRGNVVIEILIFPRNLVEVLGLTEK